MPYGKPAKITHDGGSRYFLTVSAIASVALAVTAAVWDKIEMLFGSLTTKNIPAECLETSPPTSACVNQVFPWLIIPTLSLMIIYTIKTFFLDKPSKEVLDIIAEEFDKRHDVLCGLLEELENGFSHKEDDDDIELFNSKVVWESLRPLLELPNHNDNTAKEGFRWLWIVLTKELRVSLKLTKEGEDVKFSSGNQLRSCVKGLDEMVVRSYDYGYGPSSIERKMLFKLKREAVYYLRLHGLKTVVKAHKMAMLAKEAFPWLLLQTFFTTVTAMLSPLTLHYRAQVLQNLNDVQGNVFWEAAKAMVLVELLSTILDLLEKMVKVQAAALASKEISLAYYDGLLKMPATFWQAQTNMSWRDKVHFWTVYDFQNQVTAFFEIPQKFLRDLVQALTYAFLVLRTSSRSLALLICANFCSVVIFWVLNRIESRLSVLSTNGVIEASVSDLWCCSYSLMPEYVSTYASFVRGPLEIKRFAKILTARAEKSKRKKMVEVFSSPVSSMVFQGSQIAQFSTARTNVIRHGLGVVNADAMVKSAENFVEEVEAIGSRFGKVVEAAMPLARAYDIISLPKTINPDTGLWPTNKAKGVIEFKDVRFKYPRRDVDVLKGVSFTVQSGETIGMTGSAGCGKSTCMKLLERFYDVSAGSILLDGVDIREYNPNWLRGQISTVAQEPKLIPCLSIRENLTFGCDKEPSLEEIYGALRAANIYDSIMNKEKFPQGLRTQIDSASNVSGGEKQRIAIARALLANPPILLLDEATSALDEENQEKVQEALNKLMKGRTTLIIAHRLSTIKNSSKIVAFDEGKVIEEGTHECLLAKKGSLYKKLWNKQTSKRLVEEEDEEEEEEMKEEEGMKPLEVDDGTRSGPSGLFILINIMQDLSNSDPKKKELQQVYKILENAQQDGIIKGDSSPCNSDANKSSGSEELGCSHHDHTVVEVVPSDVV